MISLLVLGVLIILSPILFLSYVMFSNRKLAKLPGPLAVPFIGSKPPNNVEETFQLIEYLLKKYGATSRTYIGFLMRVFTAEVSVIEYITQSNVHMRKTLLYDLIKPWLGEGLLISVGLKWQRMRKLLTPSFHFSILNGFLEIMNEASDEFVKKLGEEEGKTSVNVLTFTQRYSLDIIAESSMGLKLKTQNYENEDFIEATNTYLEMNVERGYSWWKPNEFLYKMFAKNYKKSQECLATLHKMSAQVIANKYKQSIDTPKDAVVDDTGTKRKLALVDTLFENRIANGLSDEDIQAEIDTFMFEGFDTVSRALAFAFYELGQNQDVQQKLFQEIEENIDDSEPLTQKKIMDLKYLDKVVKEVMRHRSSVPFVERKLEEDAVIDGKFYPKDTVFVLLIYWLHRNPQYFPDPEKFDPERFSPENSHRIPNFAYVPFSAGPRNCIGQRFALLELKAAIIHTIKKLEILPVPGHKLNLVFNSLLDSTTQILVRIKKRNV